MLQRVYHRVYDYICQKIIEKNSKLFPGGIIDINPSLLNDCLSHTCRLEYRINKLDELAIRVKVKERIYNDAIIQCHNMMEEIFPLLGTTMKLITQRIEPDESFEQDLNTQSKPISVINTDDLFRENKKSVSMMTDEEKQKILNKTLVDTFTTFKKKRDDINTWLTQLKSNPSLQIEA